MTRVRIATWNINGLRARFDFLVHWLRARQPDVVGLQELKATEDNFPFDELRDEGYHAVIHGQKAWNGVAILSRNKAEVKTRGLPGQEEFGARLITAEVDGLSFTTLYCPNGKSTDHEDFPRKLAWYDDLAAHLEATKSDLPRIVCGDFNVCPTPLDSWNEKRYEGRIFHTVEERTRYARLLDSGLTDLFRHLHPDEPKFSWWDYRGGSFHKNEGLRIDFLLSSPEIVARVATAETDREYRKKKDGLTASDHAPVIAELHSS